MRSGGECMSVVVVGEEVEVDESLLSDLCPSLGDSEDFLGLDCEWVPEGSHFTHSYSSEAPPFLRRNVEEGRVCLLQLSSRQGYTVIIRLCLMEHIPQLLKELLENPKIVKMGVEIGEDCRRLERDWGVSVESWLDIRFLYSHSHLNASNDLLPVPVDPNEPQGNIKAVPRIGLQGLTATLFGIEIEKNPKITRSNWGAEKLSEEQINYAAKDSQLSVDCGWMLLEGLIDNTGNMINKEIPSGGMTASKICDPYLNWKFKKRVKQSGGGGGKAEGGRTRKLFTSLLPNQSQLYDNCELQAPDGERLAFISKRRAEWYVAQGLATRISPDGEESEIVVKLHKEPSGRPRNDSALYYCMRKVNRCVCCGRGEMLLRKSIVPKSYRAHFPHLIKESASHDILLLCIACHQRANMSESRLMSQLADEYGIPLQKQTEIDVGARKVCSAGKALLRNRESIPQERREVLEKIVADHYGITIDSLTEDILKDAANVQFIKSVADGDGNETNETTHGFRVVEVIKQNSEGLASFERMWRKYFVDKMKPKFLPEMWNVNHNAEKHTRLLRESFSKQKISADDNPTKV